MDLVVFKIQEKEKGCFINARLYAKLFKIEKEFWVEDLMVNFKRLIGMIGLNTIVNKDKKN